MSSLVEEVYLGMHAALVADAGLTALVPAVRIRDTYALPGTAFPHITIDSPTEQDFTTFGNPGNDGSFVIHIWSRDDTDATAEYPTNMQQVNAIYKHVERILNNVRLNIGGIRHVVGRTQLLGSPLDADNRTRHGIVRYSSLAFA